MYFEKFALHFHKTLIKAVCCLACNSDLDLMLTGQSWIEYWVILYLVKFFTHKNVFLSYYKAVDKLQQENNICYTN